jgi:tRNA G10  N-methylase Trm11
MLQRNLEGLPELSPSHSKQLNHVRGDADNEETECEFIFILALGNASLIEIDSAIQLMNLDAVIGKADEFSAVVKTDPGSARSLIHRLGGSYKYGRIIGHSISDALDRIALPFRSKFNWTVSAYECHSEFYDETYRSLHELLKAKGLSKAKFLEPKIHGSIEQAGDLPSAVELKASVVRERILLEDPNDPGVDLVVHGGVDKGKPIFAQTIETFDSSEFERRDADRPYQDSTKTLSPRTARALVNIALKAQSRSLLDPFCGLGTILQEALLCNVSVIGVDRDQNQVGKAKANLEWLSSKYHVSGQLRKNLFAYDARRISRARLPRIDAIASEPILLPIFKENPSVSESVALIEKVHTIYERCLSEFASILSQPEDRIALVSPVLVDSSGKRRSFDLKGVAMSAGLKPYHGSERLASRISSPFSLESNKKRTVQRSLEVFYLS